MEHWITEIMNQFGYIGIFLLIAIENLFPPIPSEVILTFGGFMTTQSNLSIIGVIIASTIGSVVGAVILYWIGVLLDVKRLEAIIVKYGRILRLTNKDIHKADAWFTKYGSWAVFVCRFVPLIRSLISIPAGSIRMNFATFISLTTLGSLIWNAVLIYVGAAVGASWGDIVGYMDVYSNIVYAALALIFALCVFLFMKKRFLKSKAD
ncbi:membrane protein DedA with SNARE-associated domain [Paenibacillus anaericanus]|uniref:DedA family protein n=1 Tax=Paenibacillus anaericanus TaxID=170367 RepID=A0A3S1DTT3_9BACL|nr:DedA family protein [Paenibacillus anaericanus]MDQ0091004.1 membrane protein DedA with SNARE-associated domain [Paenibacillus anaericanus]RUT47207.1 DedA family protein [Paenibacillus anaericanus]